MKKLYYSLRAKFIAWLVVDVLKVDFFIDWEENPVKISHTQTREGRWVFIAFKYGDWLQKWYKVNRTAGELHDRIYLKKK